MFCLNEPSAVRPTRSAYFDSGFRCSIKNILWPMLFMVKKKKNWQTRAKYFFFRETANFIFFLVVAGLYPVFIFFLSSKMFMEPKKRRLTDSLHVFFHKLIRGFQWRISTKCSSILSEGFCGFGRRQLIRSFVQHFLPPKFIN